MKLCAVLWAGMSQCHLPGMSESPSTPNSSEPQGLVKAAAFPRGTSPPVQSPQFWVEQKSRYLRQLLIRDIEAITGRRLVVYFANRYSVGAEINASDLANLTEVLGDLQDQPVDLFLETGGGETDATEAIISMIKSTTTDMRVIVANAAKSNGTLLALASNCIVMGATSELGPIEPSLNGIPSSILSSNEVAQTNFVLHKLGTFALQQTKKLAKNLLTNGMMRDNLLSVDATVEALATRDTFPSHGSVVDHREAVTLGLHVDYLPPDNALWQKIWLLYCMYDHDCRKDKLIKVFEARFRSLSIAITAP